MDSMRARALRVLTALAVMAPYAQATGTFKDVPCEIIRSINLAITAIGAALVTIMFIFGGLKYMFSADDPGGRKSGKNTCIHAIIGGILIIVWTGIRGMLTAASPAFLDWGGCGI